MNNRQQTIWVIISVLTFLSVVLAGVKLYPVVNTWQGAVERAENIKIGTDEELENTINFLEDRLRNRLDYTFAMEKNPMLITNVIYLTNSKGRRLGKQRRSRGRITHIINGRNRYVGIQHMGQNYTLVEGDSIDGGEIVRIDVDGIVLSKENQEKYIRMITSTQKELNGLTEIK